MQLEDWPSKIAIVVVTVAVAAIVVVIVAVASFVVIVAIQEGP